MEYTSPNLGSGTAIEMMWGDYRASLPEADRATLRSDPLNRTPSEVAIERMRTGKGPDEIGGYLITPDGGNPYADPASRWLDKTTFWRLYQRASVPI